ncbi:hypothetical protein TSOC_003368 [Tetrabaena socialis]|uniref:Uncharacterized protein n=1 Tax=Tetrabaena socialis TaxID=47790 RepID=A0A2J8ABQ9_9CHLO|nr:hypothetical protein TSOC_003368 [Tetrabaena socialis]|eukprot:PNH09959.1 hypothetical protein TSOC_003368 [Tetrabaena socialis]
MLRRKRGHDDAAEQQAPQRPRLAAGGGGGAFAVVGPTAAFGGAMEGTRDEGTARAARTLRGGAGTEKMCQACHWPVKGASDHGVVHSRASGCTWAGGQLPCGVCARPMTEHAQLCVRGAGFQPKEFSELG